jgi:hypothetical protein
MRYFFKYIMLLVALMFSAISWAGVKVGVVLPLHDKDGDGLRMVEYYRGILMAVDQLKHEGYDIVVSTWNVPQDGDISVVTNDKNAAKCDLIFGPLYTSQVKDLGDFCKSKKIKLVIPFSISSWEVTRNDNIFQIYQTPYNQTLLNIRAYNDRFANAHTVLVDCMDQNVESRKGEFTKKLRENLDAKNTKYNMTSLGSNEDSFQKAFSHSEPNVVVLNSSRMPELSKVIARLDKIKVKYPNIVISLYGYNEWFMYVPYLNKELHRYDAYIPTNYYFNAAADNTIAFEKAYKGWFHTEMQNSLPRFAITGYDHAEYFIRGIKAYGKKFVGTKSQSNYAPIQTPLFFERVGEGGYVNKAFQLIHYKNNGGLESVRY